MISVFAECFDPRVDGWGLFVRVVCTPRDDVDLCLLAFSFRAVAINANGEWVGEGSPKRGRSYKGMILDVGVSRLEADSGYLIEILREWRPVTVAQGEAFRVALVDELSKCPDVVGFAEPATRPGVGFGEVERRIRNIQRQLADPRTFVPSPPLPVPSPGVMVHEEIGFHGVMMRGEDDAPPLRIGSVRFFTVEAAPRAIVEQVWSDLGAVGWERVVGPETAPYGASCRLRSGVWVIGVDATLASSIPRQDELGFLRKFAPATVVRIAVLAPEDILDDGPLPTPTTVSAPEPPEQDRGGGTGGVHVAEDCFSPFSVYDGLAVRIDVTPSAELERVLRRLTDDMIDIGSNGRDVESFVETPDDPDPGNPSDVFLHEDADGYELSIDHDSRKLTDEQAAEYRRMLQAALDSIPGLRVRAHPTQPIGL
jgi:hypothetical protein